MTSAYQGIAYRGGDWLWDFVFAAIEERLRSHRRHLEWIDLRLGSGQALTQAEGLFG